MQRKKEKFAILPDEELMLHVRNGEELAFDELYIRYSKPLLAYFTRMLNFNRTIAEDALQDVFLKIAEAPERFDGTRSFKTWIFSVAHNSCKNYYRHKKVVDDSRDELMYLEDEFDPGEFARAAARIDGSKFRRRLDELLDELPPEKREAFILKYQEEKSIADIAYIQNCPEGSVKSRLHYTLKLLGEKLKLFNPVF
jgi:RNA polymerase sigma-70 factor (ECF subfamily)